MLDSEWQDLLEKFREADEKYHTASFWLRAVPCPEPTPELLSLSPDYRNVVVADTGQLAVPIGVVELTCPTRILAVRPMPHFQADSSGVLFRLTEASNSNCCRPMSFSDADSLDKKSNGLKSGRGDKTGASWHMFWSLMDAMPAQDASALIDALPGPVHLGGTKLNGLLPAWHRAVKAFFELARLGGDLLSKRDLESMWVSEEPEPETLWAQFLGNALSSLEIPGSPPSQVLMMASNAVEVTRPFFSSIETIKAKFPRVSRGFSS